MKTVNWYECPEEYRDEALPFRFGDSKRTERERDYIIDHVNELLEYGETLTSLKRQILAATWMIKEKRKAEAEQNKEVEESTVTVWDVIKLPTSKKRANKLNAQAYDVLIAELAGE